jgi:hypothetical protein
VEDAIWGDADDSGALTANDSAMIVLYALDPVSANLSEKAIKYSDVNADGKLSAEDAAMVLQKTLDAEYVFPALK